MQLLDEETMIVDLLLGILAQDGSKSNHNQFLMLVLRRLKNNFHCSKWTTAPNVVSIRQMAYVLMFVPEFIYAKWQYLAIL